VGSGPDSDPSSDGRLADEASQVLLRGQKAGLNAAQIGRRSPPDGTASEENARFGLVACFVSLAKLVLVAVIYAHQILLIGSCHLRVLTSLA
jgi:hypothetical protein